MEYLRYAYPARQTGRLECLLVRMLAWLTRAAILAKDLVGKSLVLLPLAICRLALSAASTHGCSERIAVYLY